jgi:serine/threonine-protein kinase
MVPTVSVDLDGKYLIQSVLGHGGMGAVFRAVDVATGQPLAIKVMDCAQKEALERFNREVVLTSRLEHPNALRVLGNGVAPDGQPYLAMELLVGRPLREEMNRAGKMPLDRAVPIMMQVLRALHAAHFLGIVHRDVKPANIFLHRGPDGHEVVKVMDFGIAILTDAGGDAWRVTQTGTILGTPQYMSPEQARAEKLDARTDLYSAGLVFYELLAGEAPFRAETPLQSLLKQIREPAPPLTRYRPDLAHRDDVEKLLRRLLAKSRDERCGSAQEAMEMLEELPVEPTPSTDAVSEAAETVRPGSLVSPLATERPPASPPHDDATRTFHGSQVPLPPRPVVAPPAPAAPAASPQVPPPPTGAASPERPRWRAPAAGLAIALVGAVAIFLGLRAMSSGGWPWQGEGLGDVPMRRPVALPLWHDAGRPLAVAPADAGVVLLAAAVPPQEPTPEPTSQPTSLPTSLPDALPASLPQEPDAGPADGGPGADGGQPVDDDIPRMVMDIQSRPRGASAFVNGVFVGRTPVRPLLLMGADSVRVTVEKPGFHRYDRALDPLLHTRLDVKLQPRQEVEKPRQEAEKPRQEVEKPRRPPRRR